MRVIERPFSDLLRHPREVTVDVEEGDVLLRRRDEPDLRLTRADREADRETALAAFGRTLRNLALHNPGALAEALADAFPWIEFLTVDDRRVFVDEFSLVAAAAADMGSYGPLTQFVREWRATAEIEADPGLARRLRGPIVADGDAIPLPG
ncbi:MAG: DUF6247 family protein [Candidatus Dormibacteria bacterium]